MNGPYNKKSQGSLRRLSLFKILLVVNTDTDEVHHGIGRLNQSKQRFDTDFANFVKSRASELELISLVAAYRSDISRL